MSTESLVLFFTALLRLAEIIRRIFRLHYYYLSAMALYIPNVVIRQPAVKLHSFGQFALNVLKLLSPDAEGIHVARDLISWPHPLENYALLLNRWLRCHFSVLPILRYYGG
ncbi:MAG TPA: hypothetical protein VH161_04575, partial [Candidatus Acidoferrales bacterium]|nr:hypothetical protein [Candidatus Acidoferrales bacterium]